MCTVHFHLVLEIQVKIKLKLKTNKKMRHLQVKNSKTLNKVHLNLFLKHFVIFKLNENQFQVVLNTVLKISLSSYEIFLDNTFYKPPCTQKMIK